MATFHDRVPENVTGKFYVDQTCIYCELCVEIAPAVFREVNEMGWAAVFSQPSGDEDFTAAKDAVEACPTESIGIDGETHDWSTPALVTGAIVPNQSTDPTFTSGTSPAGQESRLP